MHHLNPVCSYCFTKLGYIECSVCKSVDYCSKECEAADAIEHKKECDSSMKRAKEILKSCTSQVRDILIEEMDKLKEEFKDIPLSDINNYFITLEDIIEIEDTSIDYYFGVNELNFLLINCKNQNSKTKFNEQLSSFHNSIELFKKQSIYVPNKIILMILVSIKGILYTEICQIY